MQHTLQALFHVSEACLHKAQAMPQLSKAYFGAGQMQRRCRAGGCEKTLSRDNTLLKGLKTPLSRNNTVLKALKTPLSRDNTALKGLKIPLSHDNTLLKALETPLSCNNAGYVYY